MYHTGSDEAGNNWDWKHRSGVDLATPFYATEYTMEHLGLPETLQKNIHLQYYDAGHMMYLRDEDLAKLKTNIANFIDGASK